MKPPSVEAQVAFLRRVPLLAGFDTGLLEILTGIMTLERLPAGEVLCKQGGPGNACFIIGHGQVEVVTGEGDDEQVLSRLGPGHVVGEVSLVDGKRRSATVRCRSDASIFTLKRDDFERLLHAGNHGSMRLLDSISQALAHRVREVNQRYADIFSKSGQTISKLSAQLRTLQASVEADAPDDPEGSATADLMALVGYKEPGA